MNKKFKYCFSIIVMMAIAFVMIQFIILDVSAEATYPTWITTLTQATENFNSYSPSSGTGSAVAVNNWVIANGKTYSFVNGDVSNTSMYLISQDCSRVLSSSINNSSGDNKVVVDFKIKTLDSSDAGYEYIYFWESAAQVLVNITVNKNTMYYSYTNSSNTASKAYYSNGGLTSNTWYSVRLIFDFQNYKINGYAGAANFAGATTLTNFTGGWIDLNYKSGTPATQNNKNLARIRYASTTTGGLDDVAIYYYPTGGAVSPSASIPTVSGTYQQGQALSPSYTYNANDGGAEVSSAYVWETATDSGFTTGVSTVASGNTTSSTASSATYTIASGDVGKYIRFRVTPKGSSALSPFSNPDFTGWISNSSNAHGILSKTSNIGAINVAVNGSMTVGSNIFGSYTYSDTNGTEFINGSEYKWLRVDNGNRSVIKSGTTTAATAQQNTSYILTNDDVGKTIIFEVTPQRDALNIADKAYESTSFGPIIPLPSVSNVYIDGIPCQGNSVAGKYTYSDYNNRSESGTIYNWYITDSATMPVVKPTAVKSSTTDSSYQITADNVGKYIWFEVVPGCLDTQQIYGIAKLSQPLFIQAKPVASNIQIFYGNNNTLIRNEVQQWHGIYAKYTYSSQTTTAEGNSVFSWDVVDGSGNPIYDSNNNPIILKSGITSEQNAVSDTLIWVDNKYIGKYLRFKITPKSAVSLVTGETVIGAVKEIIAYTPALPVVSNASVAGVSGLGSYLSASYIYHDEYNNNEASQYSWLRADDADFTTNVIILKTGTTTSVTVANDAKYQITTDDLGKFLRFQISPRNHSEAYPVGNSIQSISKPVQKPQGNDIINDNFEDIGKTGGQGIGISVNGWTPPADKEILIGTDSTQYLYTQPNSTTLDIGKTLIAPLGGNRYDIEIRMKTATAQGYYLNLKSGGNLVLSFGLSYNSFWILNEFIDKSTIGSTLLMDKTNGVTISPNTWYNIKLKLDFDNHQMYFYIGTTKDNMALYVNRPIKFYANGASGSYFMENKIDSIHITSSASSANNYIAGVDDVRVYNDVSQTRPVAYGINITGTPQTGLNLQGSYIYTDAENDTEGSSIYKWYRADNSSFTSNVTAISGANGISYTPTNDDLNKYIKFSVKPMQAVDGFTGTEAFSMTIGSIIGPSAPIASGLMIYDGFVGIGNTLKAKYSYYDANGDIESGTKYQWQIADNTTNFTDIPGALGTTTAQNSIQYTITPTDMGRYVRLKLTPVNDVSSGDTVYSEPFYLGEQAPMAYNSLITENNTSKTLISVSADMKASTSGETLKGTYSYYDANNNTESGSEYQWCISDSQSGTYTPIMGANTITFTPSNEYGGKYILFQITPKNQTTPTIGNALQSKPVLIVAPPTATEVSIGGTAKVNSGLTGKYTFSDLNNDSEFGSSYRWLSSASSSGLFAEVGNTINYNVSSSDEGNYLVFEVTPRAKSLTGKLLMTKPDVVTGQTVRSSAIRVSSNSSVTPGGGTGGVGDFSYSPQASVKQDNQPNSNSTIAQFADVDGHWARESILRIAEEKITNGKSENKFEPNLSVSRAEFLAFIMRILKLEIIKYKPGTFEDVGGDAWYADIVQTAFEKGLISGSNGRFNPNNNITREEMTKLIVEAFTREKSGASISTAENKFEDNRDISSWAVKYVEQAVYLGFVKGVDSTHFMPQKNATRAEAAVIIIRLLDAIRYGRNTVEKN